MIRSKIQRLHARKSSKLIFVVIGGVSLLLLAFFTLIISGGGGSRGRSMAKTLAYLKNTEGLLEVRALEEEKRALIVFSSDSKNAGNFEKVAHFAAVRLAPAWPECEVQLARNSASQVVYRVVVRGGAIASEGPPATE
jgi:hypothetical protein